MCAEVWGGFAERLSRQWRVTVVNLPGHGGAAPLSGPFAADAVADVLIREAPQGAVWLGWSLGALLALEAANRGASPRGVIFVAGTPRFVRSPDWPWAVDPGALRAVEAQVANDPGRALTKFVQLLGVAGGAERRAAHGLLKQLKRLPEPDPNSLAGGLAVLRESDMRGSLRDFPCASLWLGGDRDPLVPAEALRESARLSGGECRILNGAGHLPFITHPDAVVQAIRGWWNTGS